MRLFEMRSQKYDGKIVYKFGDADRLAGIDYSEANLTVEQADWIMKHVPLEASMMKILSNLGFDIVEVKESIDFKSFWDRYNDKARSSRVKTERVWNRMSRSEQVKAYNFVPKYFNSIPGGVMKKYATTYLNDQLWNN